MGRTVQETGRQPLRIEASIKERVMATFITRIVSVVFVSLAIGSIYELPYRGVLDAHLIVRICLLTLLVFVGEWTASNES